MWGWVGDPDPMSLLSFFTTGALGGIERQLLHRTRAYDELFELQQKRDRRRPSGRRYIAEMQQIFYDNAPYTSCTTTPSCTPTGPTSSAAGSNQPPDTGTPLFGYGPIGYTLLTLADGGAPSPSAAASAPAAPSGAAAHAGAVRQRVGRQPASTQRHRAPARGRRSC